MRHAYISIAIVAALAAVLSAAIAPTTAARQWNATPSALAAGFALEPIAAKPVELWRIRCSTDAATNERFCLLLYMADGPRFGVSGLLSFSWHRDGRLMLTGSMFGGLLCDDKPVIVQVDKNDGVALANDGRFHIIIGESAESVARQFRTGSSALVRFHVKPSCQPFDMPVSLYEFNEAWKRFLDGSK